jgi:hypothetical protein
VSLDAGKGEAFVDEDSGDVSLDAGTNADAPYVATASLTPLQLRLGLELRLGLSDDDVFLGYSSYLSIGCHPSEF